MLVVHIDVHPKNIFGGQNRGKNHFASVWQCVSGTWAQRFEEIVYNDMELTWN